MGQSKSRRLLGFTAITGIGLAISGCAGGTGPASSDGGAAPTVQITGSTGYPQTHPNSLGLVEWADSVTESSDGRLSFEWYYGDSLVALPDNASALDDGLIDVGYIVPAYTPAEFPADAWASRIGYGNDKRPVVGLLAAAAATIEFGYTEPALREEIEANGTMALIPRFQMFDNYNMICGSEVTSLEDARGKRVRVGGEAYARFATYLGMTPVSMTASEMYEGMERGIVDCMIGGEIDMTGQGLWEVASEWTQIYAPGWNSVALGLGNDIAAEMGDENVEVIKSSLGDFVNAFFTNYLQEQHKFFSTGADLHSVSYHQADAELTQAIDDFYADQRKSMIAEAPASFEDPEGSLDRYDELLAKWTDIVIELGYDPGTTDRVEWASEELDVDLTAWADRVQSELFDVYVG